MKKLLLMVLTLVLACTAVGCSDGPVEDADGFLTVEEIIEMAKKNTASSGGSGDIEVTGTPNFTVPASGYDGSEVTITFYHTMGKNLSDVLALYITEFNKIYPKITVVHEQVGSYDDVKSQISMELTTGKGPSLAYCYPDHVAMYNLAKSVVTLDNLIADPNLGLTAEQKADFIESYYVEGQVYGDGLMYTMPLNKSTEVMYYDKTFFEKHGLKVPTNWDEMWDVCEQIKAIDPTCYPLGYDAEENWFITLCEQMKTGYTSASGEHYLFNNDANKAFIKTLRENYEKGYFTTQELYGAYTSGLFTTLEGVKSYMSIGSSAGATNQAPTKVNDVYPFEVNITTVPQMDATNPKVISQGPSVCIFQQENPQEVYASWLLVKFLTTDVEFQASFSEASGYVPAIKNVNDDEIYKEFLDSADGFKTGIAAYSAKVCLEQEKAYYVSPAFNGSSTARDEVGLLMQTCFSNYEAAADKLAMIKEKFAAAIEECEY